MSEKAKANAEKRKQRDAEMMQERRLIHDNLIAILSDKNTTASERLRAAELLRDYSL